MINIEERKTTLVRLIEDSEKRVGQFIIGGGDSSDAYVKNYVAKVNKWIDEYLSLTDV